MTPDQRRRIEAATGAAITATASLQGGSIAAVHRIDLADGTRIVAKSAPRPAGFEIEGYMLRYLREASALPLPRVLLAEDDLLLMTYIEAGDTLDAESETHAADLLAALHAVEGPAFGHECDTLIGPLPQPNPWTASWRDFFRDQRLLAMGRTAHDAGHLPADTFAALETLCGRLDRIIPAVGKPSLIHGDMWGGNVLCRQGRVTGFVDPAIYHADAEIELAFSTLFGTFGDAFFRRYAEHRPIAPEFFSERRDLYNLYPPLVHAALFGGNYARSAAHTIQRFL